MYKFSKKLNHDKMIKSILWTSRDSFYNISTKRHKDEIHKHIACIISCWEQMLEEYAINKKSDNCDNYVNNGGFSRDCAMLQIDFTMASTIMDRTIHYLINDVKWKKS